MLLFKCSKSIVDDWERLCLVRHPVRYCLLVLLLLYEYAELVITFIVLAKGLTILLSILMLLMIVQVAVVLRAN